ncbi:hypothetical protein ACTQ5K_08925 [Niallia sp. Sow4_A1]|uniref:hypothetical protein n=1 Tax=unclassified Niallia TaxID=2837522 RepID=UPI00203D6649|nr:hypothetical protein [Niallia sp. MER TA 168]MCM3364727.1 hypothetical protein [Niallia sp. MER TA 168]
MNKSKSAILIPLSVLIIFMMYSWKDGELHVLTVAGGLVVSILLYVVIVELIKGIHSFQQNQNKNTEDVISQMSQDATTMAEQMKELREAVVSSSTLQTELLEKNRQTLASSLVIVQQKLEILLEAEKEVKSSLNDGVEKLYRSIIEQGEGLQGVSKNILDQMNQNAKDAKAYQESVTEKINTIGGTVDQQTEIYQSINSSLESMSQGVVEELKALEQQSERATEVFVKTIQENANSQQDAFTKQITLVLEEMKNLEESSQSLLKEQLDRQLEKSDALLVNFKDSANEQQEKISEHMSTILEEIKGSSTEQLQSLQQLAQTIKDDGQELQGSFFENLSSYKEGLQDVITMMKESAVTVQEEIMNQSGEQVKKIEEVIEVLKNNTSSFHEKMDNYMTSAHDSTIHAQQQMTNSTIEQSQKLEDLSSALKDRFEEMQAGVAKRMENQYTAVTTIVEKLNETVEGSQAKLDDYTKQQVVKLNEVVELTKTETAKSLQELKTQGKNQHDHMQRFLKESKEEAVKTRGSMDQHHRNVLRELEGSLAKVVKHQIEENKVIVQRTSDVINQFSSFHKELISEHQKQLQLASGQQEKLKAQVDDFRDLLIPLTDLHHNLQAMSKEEYKKLYETMEILSSTLVDTIESKNSLRTHIVRMQDEMLQKLR